MRTRSTVTGFPWVILVNSCHSLTIATLLFLNIQAEKLMKFNFTINYLNIL